MKIKCLAFDCFGTVFNMGGVSREEIGDYVRHVKSDNFSPYVFPNSWLNLGAHPDAKPGIEVLRSRGYHCVTLSNGSYDLLDHLSRMAGIEWDQIIDLAKHKVYKPNSDAYKVVEKETGFTPDETIMVTANPTFGDIEGSASIGMPSIVIRQPGYRQDILSMSELFRNKR